MASTARQRLKHIVKNPYLNLVVSVAFTIAGLLEAYRELAPGGEFSLGANDGVILLGLFHTLRSFSDVLDRFETIEDERQGPQ